MTQRKYFEFFAKAGRPATPDKDIPYSVDNLLEDMSYARIHGASLFHNATSFSYQYGNSEAIKITKNNNRLFALAIVPTTANIETGCDYFNDLLDNGVRGFIVLSKSAVHSLFTPKSMEKIAEALVSHHRPLIATNVNSDEQFEKLITLANTYPELNIIMQGISWTCNRQFMEAMDSASNLYFDISSNHTNSLLELTKKHFGIERALYSSTWPTKSMGAMKSFIEYADISDSDKDLVAHGNACRLFGINPANLELYDDSKCEFDEIAMEADAGKPISVHVIDAHSHIVGSGNSMNTAYMPDRDATSIASKMDRMGVDTTITAPWIGISYDGTQGNKEVIEAADKHPGKYLGFSTCNVNYPDEIEAVKEFHLKHPDLFVGIKPYPPGYNFKLNDAICKEWLEFANEHHLPALIHCEWMNYADEVDAVAGMYPNITFILAHSGASYQVAKYNAALAKKYDNIVLDITYTTTGRGMVEFLVEQAGADKVIYGTDTPMRDPAPQLGWVCYAKLSTEDKKKILAGNIEKIINKRK